MNTASQDPSPSAEKATPSALPPGAARAATAAECSAAPAQGHNRGYEGGYDAGFADGVDQVASDLLPAAKAVADLYMLTAESSSPPEILRLREAIAACEAAL